MYYRGAEAAVITYDITSESSFARAKDWLHEVVANVDDDLGAYIKKKDSITMTLADQIFPPLPQYWPLLATNSIWSSYDK